MASKRMFDKAIIDTDRFMDMQMSAKALYFLLGMEADDEGFVSYKKVMRVHGGNEDDLRVLATKKFIIGFPSGVVVITEWNQNNWLDSRRLRPTQYQDEKKLLSLTQDKRYVLSNGLASIEETSIEETKNLAVAKAPASPSKESTKKTTGTDSNSQSNVVTLEEYLEQFEEIEKYNPAIEDTYRAWLFPGVKTPQTIEQMERRYSTHLKGQTRVSGPSRGQLEASSVWLRWVELCEKELGKKPIADAKSRAIIKFAINKVGKDEVMEVIEDWFHQGKPDEETIQITRALSGHQLNSFIARQ